MDLKVNGKSYEFSSYMATGIAEGFEEADDCYHYVAAWQYLVLSGLCWSLQGSFGRAAESMINQGILASRRDYEPEFGIHYEPMLEEYNN